MAIPIDMIGMRLADIWSRYLSAGAEYNTEISGIALKQAPLIWLLGRVQSGKTSVVHAITGCSTAEIGSGFRPCTRDANIFDFPPEAPLVSFLDTRGFGEVGYKPDDDIAAAMQRAHLLLAVVRVLDQQLDELCEVIGAVRKNHPGWPIVIAQTCLHEAYAPGEGHIQPYPFGGEDGSLSASGIPIALQRSLSFQRDAIRRAAGKGAEPLFFVPIDFTQPGDGFEPTHYGLEALLAAIGVAAPLGVLDILNQLREGGEGRLSQIAHPRIMGHASAAAVADALPLAGAVAVPGIQARLLYLLGNIYGVTWDRALLAEFAGCLGGAVVARLAASFGFRQVAKLIPVYGQTVMAATSAATSYATTYAIGKAAEVFLSRRNRGMHEDADAVVAEAYREALKTALGLARAHDAQGASAKDLDDAAH